MKVHIIYNDRRLERYEPLLNELKNQCITDYEIFPCVLRDNVVESISLSFKMIVRMAKEQGLKEVCIFEDDVYFPHPKGWEYFLKNKPENFDIYIGGSYLTDIRNKYEAPLVKVDDYVGNQCIIIHEKYYDTFLGLPDNEHIDTANRWKGDFYVCFPFPALQRSGWSANNGAVCDYNQILDKEFIYQ